MTLQVVSRHNTRFLLISKSTRTSVDHKPRFRGHGVYLLSNSVLIRDEIAPVIPGQTVSVDLEEVKAFRRTYRFLSYCLASGGFPVRNDLAGVDRPDLVDALTREIYGWAGLTPPR